MINELKPEYFSFIIPSRWLTGGKGLNTFRKNMLEDKRFSKIFDFKNSKDCFKEVEIEGGVLYFLWEKEKKENLIEYNFFHDGKFIKKDRILNEYDIFIRDNIGIDILKKIEHHKLKTISTDIKRSPFGFNTNFKDFKYKQDNEYKFLYIGNKNVIANNETEKSGIGFICEKYIKQKDIQLIKEYKILTPKARGGVAKDKKILTEPFIVEKNSVCSQTYVILKSSDNKKEIELFLLYVKSKFFRFLVSLRKQTQDLGVSTYLFVPNIFELKDFQKIITDKTTVEELDRNLFQYFKLNEKEISYIENKITYY